MPYRSDRLKLPLLAAAQAQKEVTHNEALTMADMAVQAVVQAVAPASVPATPVLGQCWIVGPVPTGAWIGHADALACWTAAGWRYVDAFEGMQAWSIADGVMVRRTTSAWTIGSATATTLLMGGLQVVGPRRAHINAPTGGTTVDVQARATIAALLLSLEGHGLLSPT